MVLHLDTGRRFYGDLRRHQGHVAGIGLRYRYPWHRCALRAGRKRPRLKASRFWSRRNVLPRPRILAIGGAACEVAHDALVLATGAEPVRPPLPGIDLPAVHGLPGLDAKIAAHVDCSGCSRKPLAASPASRRWREADVARRIDVITMVLQMGVTVFDRGAAGPCCAPPYGAARGPVNMAAMMAGGSSWQDSPAAARSGASAGESCALPVPCVYSGSTASGAGCRAAA